MGLTKAQRYNRMWDKVYEDKKRFDERNDFVRFLDANTELTLTEAVKVFKALKNMPVY